MSIEYIPHPDEYQPDDQLAWEAAQRADEVEMDIDPDGYTDAELEEMERDYLSRYPEPPF